MPILLSYLRRTSQFVLTLRVLTLISRYSEVVICAPKDTVKKAIKFCESHACVDCPICINDIEHRTAYDKCCEFIPCVDNLIYELVVHPHYKL